MDKTGKGKAMRYSARCNCILYRHPIVQGNKRVQKHACSQVALYTTVPLGKRSSIRAYMFLLAMPRAWQRKWKMEAKQENGMSQVFESVENALRIEREKRNVQTVESVKIRIEEKVAIGSFGDLCEALCYLKGKDLERVEKLVASIFARNANKVEKKASSEKAKREVKENVKKMREELAAKMRAELKEREKALREELKAKRKTALDELNATLKVKMNTK